MKHSDQLLKELSKAKLEIEAMRNTRSLDEFEEHWKSFLSRLERVWYKASHYFGKSPKWNGWKGKYEMLRKKDPLLAYLRNARGADEHTVNEITSREPGGIGINPAKGSDLFIENITVNKDSVSIRSPQDLRIDFIPAKTKLVPVTNSGKLYPVPVSHLGRKINPSNVPKIAQVGVDFYEGFLTTAESYFVKTHRE